jgi:hypothetical protein
MLGADPAGSVFSMILKFLLHSEKLVLETEEGSLELPKCQQVPFSHTQDWVQPGILGKTGVGA